MKIRSETVRRAVPLAALAFGVAWAGAGLAQPVQEEDQVAIAFTGRVTAVDASAKTVSVNGAGGEKGVFQVDADTTVMSGSQDVGFAGLAKGQWIAIDGQSKGAAKLATYVEIVEDPGGGTSAKPAATPAGATMVVGKGKLTPSTVTIAAGQSVTFRGVVGGQKVVAADGSFSSPALSKGQAWSHSFDVPGVYPVRIDGTDAKASIVVE